MRNLLKSILFISTIIINPLSYAYAPDINPQQILANAHGLDPLALKYAIKGYHWAVAHHEINNPNILTIIDFNLPSDARRVWVLNLASSHVLMNTYTTQGKNSGLYYARHFSNEPGAEETSLGVYKTLNAYDGKHGLSERIAGLEPGLNNNAYNRAVVVHPAEYASAGYVREFHRTGRSWGCFGFDPAVSSKFINITKGGSIIFAYASPEQHDYRLAQF